MHESEKQRWEEYWSWLAVDMAEREQEVKEDEEEARLKRPGQTELLRGLQQLKRTRAIGSREEGCRM